MKNKELRDIIMTLIINAFTAVVFTGALVDLLQSPSTGLYRVFALIALCVGIPLLIFGFIIGIRAFISIMKGYKQKRELLLPIVTGTLFLISLVSIIWSLVIII